jgi:glucose-1-phosphate adenylyltransferase
VRRVGVVTQYKAHSLIKHVNRGWGHFKAELGEGVEILPASQRWSPNWYLGTADAVYQNLDIVRSHRPKYVMVLSGDHVYRQDYGEMLARHVESGADMTVSCLVVPVHEAAGSFGVMSVDEGDRVVGFHEKPERPEPVPDSTDTCLASLGNYVFNENFPEEQLVKDARDPASSHDFGGDVIPHLIDAGHHVQAYRYVNLNQEANPYWRDVGTLDAYWQASMELVQPTPPLNLYDRVWPIWTYQEQEPPAKFVFDDDNRRGVAVDSMVAGGVIISGSTVRRSILFSEARVNSYSEVDQSVILPEANIGRHCRLRKAIIDFGCKVPRGTEIGVDPEADRARGFRVTDGGVTLVTRTMLGQPPAVE